MKERRWSSRQKSLLQGRIYYNNRRSTIDCLIRDYSETGAKLKVSEAIAVPEAVELYVPNREAVHRARVEWRAGGEIGISFVAPGATRSEPDAPQGDLPERVRRLEGEILTLKRLVNELRAENRKAHGEVA